MSDNKQMQDGRDRAKVNAEEPYEVGYFAHKHGISAEQARKILANSGPSRKAADEAAARQKSS
ncbi:MAG TPA: DUF3606 domain-containing protein [Devosia sp.]